MANDNRPEPDEAARTNRSEIPYSLPPSAFRLPTSTELRERYVEQQLRLACPGCGEEAFLG